MFRVTVVGIVLLLAASPSSPLLCRAWCDTTGVAGQSCHHQAASDIALVAGDDCLSASLDTMAFLREDAGRFASSSDAHGVLVSGRHLHGLTDIGNHIVAGSLARPFNPPLSLALRI